ncbi:MAG: prolyl oligopeptidase family serine peptidase [Acidobacteriota bacterium]|nr:prolyl oligopeptidase family serine peptidase [Acidobacteriota bacterium]
MKKLIFAFAVVAFCFCCLIDICAQGYRKPPKEIEDILNAPALPVTSVSPAHDKILLATPLRYPPISELAQPMLRLAGLRINPNTNGQHRQPYFVNLTLKNISDGKETPINLPENAQVISPNWSADGKFIAFGNQTLTGIELWILDTATAKARMLKNVRVNTAFGRFDWMPDQKSLLVNLVPAKRAAPPTASGVPTEPSVQETAGKTGVVQTFEDLLKNPTDEKLFDYYATSQLAIVSLDGKIKEIGQPAIFDTADISPDGQHILTAQIKHPYSYLFPASRFPTDVEIWDLQGKTLYKIASLPLEDNLPAQGVPVGARSYGWIPTEAATVIWAEALDKGDPRTKTTPRDRLLKISAPFTAQPTEIVRIEQRYQGRAFGERDGLMFFYDYNRDTQHRRMFAMNYNNQSDAPKLISDLNINDRYNDIGTLVMKILPNGFSVVRQDGDYIFLSGTGASSEGDRPFLRKMNFKTKQTLEIFRSGKDSYESFVALDYDKNNPTFITRKESVSEPPNLILHTFPNECLLDPRNQCPTVGSSIPNGYSPHYNETKELTNFRDPTPQLRGITKRLVKYKRADGVDLSFTLYLPPNYKAGTRLPTVVWAYPLEFTDASTAGQVSGSTNRFTSIGSYSHLFFLLEGYAVLDNTTMPVVGDPLTVNDTFIKQIVDSAQAAIDKAVELGVTDCDRVGVGGHSYGAFMTANLLAHSDLFRAGIARSGAYNRTLTPFGFQSERRTFWEAPELYEKVSPFFYADKIKAPLLMIHGEADNNQGTFPIQSERLFAAIQGNGGTARLVLLPLEAHGYAAKESTEHTLFEMINWFDKYVKNAKPRERNQTATKQ